MTKQPLFDFAERPLIGESSAVLMRRPNGLAGSTPASSATWREVPAARFLSWPDAMQWAYCAARDRDSAACAENEEWRQFYLKRAEGAA